MKRTLILILLTATAALGSDACQYPTLQELAAGDIPAAPADPSLTAAVTTVGDAVELQAMTGNGKYRLTADIDLTAVVWTPIATTLSGFVLDGDGYTISNLTIDEAASHNQGLFAHLDPGTQVYDLTFQDCSVTGNSDVGILSGGMPGTGSFILSNVDTNDCTVVGQSYVGGLIGYIEDVTAGGIYDCEITNCTMTCADTGGGLTGEILMNGASTANFNVVRSDVVGGSVTVTAGYTNGGFIGEAEGDYSDFYVYFHTCTSSAALAVGGASTDGHGGFAGISDYAKWVSCSATGAVTTTDARGFIGGFVGFETGLGPGYTNCYATGAVNVTETTGPLSPYLVGGFIGKYDNIGECPVLRCYATGNVTVTCSLAGDWYGVGGFIGGLLSVGTDGGDTIQRCWSTGDVYVSDEDNPSAARKGGRGGFIGLIDTLGAGNPVTLATIQNCYAWGSLLTADNSDDASKGGFIGSLNQAVGQAQTVVLTNCYCAQTNAVTGSGLTNQITAGTYMGGFAGWNDSYTLTTTTCYYDETTSGTTTSATATNHTTDWMMRRTNYSGAGWDISATVNTTTIWYLPDCTTGYPQMIPLQQDYFVHVQ